MDEQLSAALAGMPCDNQDDAELVALNEILAGNAEPDDSTRPLPS